MPTYIYGNPYRWIGGQVDGYINQPIIKILHFK